MQIPNFDLAIIEKSKIIDYLLNINHKRGGSKAKISLNYGYSPENWQQLESDIRKFHLNAEVSIIKETSYGIRYEIIPEILTPIHKPLLMKSVWQIDKGTEIPLLITMILK
ncbi:DUF6883 domain-containing protein [Cyanobacterium aponinum AL20118]|uniref:DUF6883 domain-containing protein n=1 Tax=Cyanobacterium aponinum AL20115 TaxID=3090662 RepID=A0AAF0ZDV4_9CHRO|nr:DUF6883 domain-containing protein [Cyanobacterium aponinum]WPF88227.1 hypothetical protein SAY89_15725 [Cyanobacterium aponinum AL20115]